MGNLIVGESEIWPIPLLRRAEDASSLLPVGKVRCLNLVDESLPKTFGIAYFCSFFCSSFLLLVGG